MINEREQDFEFGEEVTPGEEKLHRLIERVMLKRAIERAVSVLKSVLKNNTGLVIIDTVTGSLSEVGKIRAALSLVKAIRAGATVVVLQHGRKSEERKTSAPVPDFLR